MAIFNYTPQSDGTTGDVADINVPFAAIAALLNAGLTLDNLAPGVFDTSIFDTNTKKGWNSLTTQPTVSSGYNKGNREFDLTFSSTDLTGILSPGMRLKLTRNTNPPTQCTDLESGSTNYASKSSPTGVTFTDDFTVEAWVKLESYTAGIILSRWNGTSGWVLRVNADGTVEMFGTNAGAANFSTVKTVQSVPLGRWIHVAATLDMSTFTAAGSPAYLDGVSVPVVVSRGGTNPTALVQAGNVELGGANGGATPFDGKLADVRLWSALRTSTQIRDNMHQQIVGNETNLVSYWKLNGDFNDTNANANNLTAQNSAVATNADNPMQSTEYAIITKVAYSSNTTVTVFTGTDYNIPNGTLTAAAWSSQRAPFGFPASRTKWRVETLLLAGLQSSTPTDNTWYQPANVNLSVPLGEWDLRYSGDVRGHTTAGTFFTQKTTLSTTTNSETDIDFTTTSGQDDAGGSTMTLTATHARMRSKSLTAQTTYYLLHLLDFQTTAGATNGFGYSQIVAECAYL